MSREERTRVGSMVTRLQREKIEVIRRISDAVRRDDNVEATFLEMRLQKIGMSIDRLRESLGGDRRAHA